MNRTPLKIGLSLIAILLFSILCLFIYTKPLNITNSYSGNMYSFKDLSFDLDSSDYIINTELTQASVERGLDTESMLFLVNPKTGISFSIFSETNSMNIELFEETYRLLKNPLEHIKLENLSSKRQSLSIVQDEKLTGIIRENNLESENKDYVLEIKIEENYYLVIPSGEDKDEKYKLILTFLSSVN